MPASSRSLLWVALGAAACQPSPPRAPIDRSADAKLVCEHDPSRADRPAIPSRAHCLASPWTDTNGVPHRTCGPRQRHFTHEGERIVSPNERLKFLERNRKAIHALAGVRSSGFGVCCDDGPGGGCVRVGVALCAVRLGDLATTIEGLWAKDGYADARLDVLIELEGLAGPRCDGEKGACLPEPYESGRTLAQQGYRCDAPRTPLRDKHLSWGACAHDGECVRSGCGNQCVPWTDSGIGTCEGYLWPKPMFCGCVTGSCSWFSTE